MIDQLAQLFDNLVIMFAVLAIVLLCVAIPMSLRRNARAIDSYEEDDVDELKICIANYQIKRATKKLEGMGWKLRSSMVCEEQPGYNNLYFKKADDPNAASIKAVIHRLNKMLLLPVSPFELKREKEETAD